LKVGAVAKWGDTPVTTVCLTGSQVYPQDPEFRFPVNSWLKTLLTPVGITITGKEGPCDATMKVSVRIVAKAAKYEGPNDTVLTLYPVGDRQVTVSLTASDRKPIVFKDAFSASEPPLLASSSTSATPREYITGASSVVFDDLLKAATDIWGPAVAVEALCLPEDEEPYDLSSTADDLLLDASGLRDARNAKGTTPSDYTSWRRWLETGEVVAGDDKSPSTGCR